MALTADKTYPCVNPRAYRSGSVAANGEAFAQSLVGDNAAGFTTRIPGPGVNNSAFRVRGQAHQRFTNAGGANGAFRVRIDKNEIVPGLKNLAGDPVTQADCGNEVYIEDDETIRRTSNGNTRTGGLILYSIESDGTCSCTYKLP